MTSRVRRVTVTGRARAEDAWERYADLGRWATWAPQICGVEADGTRLALGRSGTVRVVAGLGVPFVVTAVDDTAMTWSWIARIGPVPVTLHHDLTPVARGTRAGLTLEGPGWLLHAYAPLCQVALRRLVRP